MMAEIGAIYEQSTVAHCRKQTERLLEREPLKFVISRMLHYACSITCDILADHFNHL